MTPGHNFRWEEVRVILDIYDHYNTIIGDFKLLFIDLGDVKNTNSDMQDI